MRDSDIDALSADGAQEPAPVAAAEHDITDPNAPLGYQCGDPSCKVHGRAAAEPSPFRQVVDDLTGGCGCACHTGIGYNAACSHCMPSLGSES